MNLKNIAATLLIALIALGSVPAYSAQDTSGQSKQTDQEKKDEATPEKKAVLLLEQVVAEAQGLKLSENRIYIQISAGDLLWEHDEPRARALFAEAAGNVTELMQRSDPNNRPGMNPIRSATELRQELLLTVARHDPALAYQLLQTIPPPANTAGRGRGPDPQANLEQNLVALIAASDPKTALKSAQDWLDKGQYPTAITKVLGQLYVKDSEAAGKLSDKLLSRLQSDELYNNQEAARLTVSLLQPGPRPDAKTADGSQPPSANTSQFLLESSYHDLMNAYIVAALKATISAPVNQGRGAGAGGRGGPVNAPAAATGGAPGGPQNDAQNPQANARALLMGLQTLQPQIDKYVPDRSLAVRQKLSEFGGRGNNPGNNFGQLQSLLQQGTSESLIAAAAAAPQQMQARIYQQAANKAIDEGNTDRATQIASQHLEGTARDAVLKTIDLKKTAASDGTNKVEEIRQMLARVQSEDERTRLLLQFVGVVQGSNPKLAIQLLGEAKNLVARRATNYRQMEAQLNVAHAFVTLDPSQSFELIDPMIGQINELLSAAAVLNGFEVNILRDGELPLQNGGSLTGMVMRCGNELAELAETDFQRAQLMTERFQLPEPRIIARLAIVMGVLGGSPVESMSNGPGGRGVGQFGRRPQ